MTRIMIFCIALVLAVFVKNGDAVRCWTCSSDLDPTCGDPFNAYQPLNTHRYTLSNCDANTGVNYPYLTGSKSACKKAKQYVNGELTIIRGCTWKRADDYSSQCPTTNTPPYIRTTFCETCEYDGCNAAGTLTNTLALLLLPLAILALFK